MSAIRSASASFTRPSNTTAYAAGDLVANNTTAGSVTPMTFTFPSGRPLYLTHLKLRKTQDTLTSATFRLWLMTASPTVTNGDNGAIAGTFLSTLMCEPIQIDALATLTGGGAIGSSLFTPGLIALPPIAYGLLEATAAYSPASAEVFTVELIGEGL